MPAVVAATHETLFGLFAVSGRLGQASGLQRDDVDLVAGVITIREAKFDRSRLVPLHPTATDAPARYAASVTASVHGRARRPADRPGCREPEHDRGL